MHTSQSSNVYSFGDALVHNTNLRLDNSVMLACPIRRALVAVVCSVGVASAQKSEPPRRVIEGALEKEQPTYPHDKQRGPGETQRNGAKSSSLLEGRRTADVGEPGGGSYGGDISSLGGGYAADISSVDPVALPDESHPPTKYRRGEIHPKVALLAKSSSLLEGPPTTADLDVGEPSGGGSYAADISSVGEIHPVVSHPPTKYRRGRTTFGSGEANNLEEGRSSSLLESHPRQRADVGEPSGGGLYAADISSSEGEIQHPKVALLEKRLSLAAGKEVEHPPVLLERSPGGLDSSKIYPPGFFKNFSTLVHRRDGGAHKPFADATVHNATVHKPFADATVHNATTFPHTEGHAEVSRMSTAFLALSRHGTRSSLLRSLTRDVGKIGEGLTNLVKQQTREFADGIIFFGEYQGEGSV